MVIETTKGTISIADDVFTTISGSVATNCFGVKGMVARNVQDGLVRLLRPESLSKGVKVTFDENKCVAVTLHISVEHGVNIPAVCQSIMSEVRYHVQRLTGTPVSHVTVCIDAMMVEG